MLRMAAPAETLRFRTAHSYRDKQLKPIIARTVAQYVCHKYHMIISTNKLFATLVSAICFCALPALAQTAELPRTYIDTTYAPGPGASIYVAAGGDLQSAFNRAQPGDSILLEPGATFTGNFELPAKLGNSWIYIQTAPTPALPPVDTRITPSASPS